MSHPCQDDLSYGEDRNMISILIRSTKPLFLEDEETLVLSVFFIVLSVFIVLRTKIAQALCDEM